MNSSLHGGFLQRFRPALLARNPVIIPFYDILLQISSNGQTALLLQAVMIVPHKADGHTNQDRKAGLVNWI